MSSMIPRFIDALQHASLEMTAEEVAETLWFALQMTPASGDAHPVQDTNPLQPSKALLPKPADPNPPTHPASTQRPAAKAEATSDIYPHSQKPTNNSMLYQGAMLARIPAASALPESLALGRALRPLRRRQPSRKTFVLNERATVQQIAKTHKRIWAPVLEPALTRWFEVALVIDEGALMIFWWQTIAELRTLLERLGAFRDVRIWRLATDNKEHVKLYAEKGSATRGQTAHAPKELIDPTGRRLILVVTDCVSPAWYSGEVQKVLNMWGQKNLVTLLQMLPRRLWQRTAMCATETVHIAASTPGIANVRLKTPEARRWSSPELSIPIVTLEQKSLAPWARMVMGAENTRVLGVMFAKDSSSMLAETSSVQEDSLTPQERVRNFRAAASPTARKLAGLLSATPIILPVVRIIQQTMLPERKQEHVAEVFLGGLLKESRRDPQTTNPDYIEYDFLPGVRDELLSTLSMPDEHQVLREVSTFVGNRLGLSRDFLGRVVTPIPTAELAIDQESRLFARIAATVWRKLGGEYAMLADQLEQQLNTYDAPPIEPRIEPRNAPVPTLAVIRSEWPSDTPVLNRTCICPSCFEEISIGNCRIVSGRTPGKVLKEAPEEWWEQRMAHMNPEPLYSTEYTMELAQRECPKCEYLLPYNIELVENKTLAVVGDVYTGKSHYIAALLHQIKVDWIGKGPGYIRIACLTPEVEEVYMKDYLDTLFMHKRFILPTLPATTTKAQPLIYELVVSSLPKQQPIKSNLIIYDSSGEDYASMERLVRFARFVFNAGAFIFIADPIMMVPIFRQLPPPLKATLQEAFAALHITEERRAADRLNEVISLYERYYGYPKGAALSDIPIAIMVSKADLFTYLNLPNRYRFMMNPHYGSIVDLQDIHTVDQEVRELLSTYSQEDLLATTSNFKAVSFFATSATGMPPDPTGRFAKVEPCRCLDPVLWILYRFGIIKASI